LKKNAENKKRNAMAFDQQLEADRIDGFNLFSAFVRVPLLVLGGILGSDELSRSNDIDSDAALVKHGRSDEDDKENAASDEDNSDGRCHDKGSDCTNRLVQRRQQSNTRLDHSGTGDSSDSVRDPCHHTSGIKRTKRMSWSDERGLPLVDENDEVRKRYCVTQFSSMNMSCIKWMGCH
jgi:hypothetical protein